MVESNCHEIGVTKENKSRNGRDETGYPVKTGREPICSGSGFPIIFPSSMDTILAGLYRFCSSESDL